MKHCKPLPTFNPSKPQPYRVYSTRKEAVTKVTKPISDKSKRQARAWLAMTMGVSASMNIEPKAE